MDESYFSHIPLLVAAVYNTTGPVLELGAGLGSTLSLHGLCGAMKRKLTTLESDQKWVRKFIGLGRSWHEIRFVDSFIDLPEYNERWGLALIDHGISEQRGSSLLALRDIASIILCHDTCHFFLYGYEPVLTAFNFRWNYKPAGLGGSNPMTSVVSQTVNVAQLFAEVGL